MASVVVTAMRAPLVVAHMGVVDCAHACSNVCVFARCYAPRPDVSGLGAPVAAASNSVMWLLRWNIMIQLVPLFLLRIASLAF
eukprot:2103638-Pyramimonas_sp.AAC.1